MERKRISFKVAESYHRQNKYQEALSVLDQLQER
jgi:hypothetical protein